MSDLIQTSLAEIRARLAGGDVTAEAVTKACLDRIAETEPSIHALITVREQALEEARALDAQGPDASKPLWGVPVTVKDAIVTKGTRTTAGSKILGGFNPFYDAFVVERLKESGAVIIGKNNMRDYYLLIEKPGASILVPKLLAVYDCLSQSCKLFVDVDQKKPPYAPEETTIEVKIGQKDVTLPPNTPPPPGAPQHEFKESKLGE